MRGPLLVLLLATATAARSAVPQRRYAGSYTGFTLGFSVEGREDFWRQIPLKAPFDRRAQTWWDSVYDDAAYAGVDFVAPVTRGCNPCDGGNPGNSCPLELDPLMLARHQSRRDKTPKIALFVDTGGAFTATKNLCKRGSGEGPKFDFADADGAGEGGWQYLWDWNAKLFYERMPREDLFTIDGRPLVFFWSVSELWYTGHQGNASRFLAWFRAKVKEKLGVEPYVVVDQTWPALDSTVSPKVADGVDDWFDPTRSACTVREWDGRAYAVSVPGFRDPPWAPQPQRDLPRNGGKTLKDCLAGIRAKNAVVTLLEGLTDVEESAGYYRSADPDWAYPEQYLDIVRDSLPQKAVPRASAAPAPAPAPVSLPDASSFRWP